jgi:hypothetical protein
MRSHSSHGGILLAMVLVTSVPARGQAGRAQVKLQPTQIYTNKATQFQFPPSVAEFQRESEFTQYDPQGRDIGVGYNDLLDGVAATIFVYPIAQRPPNNTLKGHFETCKSEVLNRHPGAKWVAEGKVAVSPGGHKQEGLHAAFTSTEVFAHRLQPVKSELYLFTHRGSFVLFRLTYPAGQQATAEPAVKGFIDGLPWP